MWDQLPKRADNPSASKYTSTTTSSPRLSLLHCPSLPPGTSAVLTGSGAALDFQQFRPCHAWEVHYSSGEAFKLLGHFVFTKWVNAKVAFPAFLWRHHLVFSKSHHVTQLSTSLSLHPTPVKSVAANVSCRLLCMCVFIKTFGNVPVQDAACTSRLISCMSIKAS